MHILLVSLNYAPEPTGIGLYSSGLAQELGNRGHRVKVIAAQPHYPQWRIFDGHKAAKWSEALEGAVSVTRCPIYIPAKVNGPKRLLHYASFALSSLRPIISYALRERPDIIINVAPSLGVAPTILISTKLAGAKSWLHVQDFEVEAAFATGNLSKHGLIAKLALSFEKHVMRSFDAVSSISPEMCKKLGQKDVGSNSIYEFRNWAELNHIKPQQASSYQQKWNLVGKKVALYSGNIALKQGMEVLVDVARLMQDDKEFHLVICGEGPSRDALQANANDLANISFYDLQPMAKLSELLSLATVHLLPQKADTADLILPSKLANMLASGRPVVAGAAPGTGLAREVKGCGIAVEPDNAGAMAFAIRQILADPISYANYAKEARKRAELRWSKDAIIDGLESRFGQLLEKTD